MIPCILALAVAAASPSPRTYVLETRDPAGDQECVFHADCPYPGGDLTGARLTLREIPVARGDQTAGDHPAAVYAPVSLEIDLDPALRGGEAQLAIFVSLPPLYLEHLVVRNSLSRREANGQDVLILLPGQKEYSFVTGLDPVLDAGIEAFRASGDQRNCLFSAPPEKRREALEKAADFSIHSGTTYLFPPSPFYWRKPPEMKISVSLEVRDGAETGAERISHLISDSLSFPGGSPNQRLGIDASSYPLEKEGPPLK